MLDETLTNHCAGRITMRGQDRTAWRYNFLKFRENCWLGPKARQQKNSGKEHTVASLLRFNA